MRVGRVPSVLLWGAPGVGKGTQAAAVCRLAGCVHLSVGEVFRGLSGDCAMGRVFEGFARRGELVPDGVVAEACRAHVDELVRCGGYVPGRQVVVWDGFPRTEGQVVCARAMMEVRRVVVLEAADGVLRERMRRRGRWDDLEPAVVERRLKVYREATEGLLGLYPGELVRRINAEGAPDQVLEAILASCGRDFVVQH